MVAKRRKHTKMLDHGGVKTRSKYCFLSPESPEELPVCGVPHKSNIQYYVLPVNRDGHGDD